MRKAEDRARRRPERLLVRDSETEISRPERHPRVLDLLAQQLADEFRGKLDPVLQKALTLERLDPRLRSLERRLKDLEPDHGDHDDDGTDATFPNLKYAKPKYKDVESVLRYVESGDAGGGLKLVIMNFND